MVYSENYSLGRSTFQEPRRIKEMWFTMVVKSNHSLESDRPGCEFLPCECRERRTMFDFSTLSFLTDKLDISMGH